MDIMEKAEQVVKNLVPDKLMAGEFAKNPVKVIEKLIGKELPDDQINAIIKAVKGKISLDTLGDVLDSDGDGKPDLGAVAKLGGLFKK